MAETAAPDYPRGLTFEKVWAMFQESRQQMKEDHELSKQEHERRMKEIDRQIENMNKQMGDLHNTFGEIAEHLVAPGIVKRFNELGYQFEQVADGNVKILDADGEIKTEIDLLLENGNCIVAVEVKAKPKVKDAEHHKKRLEILREYRDKHNDKRKIQGAIAGAVFYNSAKKAALEAGFYVLEQSGDTMKMRIPKGFKPKEW
jgi:hypothetical protein